MNANDIRIGTKFDIKIPNKSLINDAPASTFTSQLLDVLSNNTISIAAPMSEGRLKFLSKGLTIMVYYLNERQELLFFEGSVLGHRKSGPLDAFDIVINTEPQKIQRRNFYRLDAALSCQYIKLNQTVLENEKLEFGAINRDELKSVYTKNISVSGFCLVTDDSIKAGDIIDAFINLDDTAEIRIMARAIRSDLVDNRKHETGMHFINITPQDSEILRKFIFEKQRLILKNTMQSKGWK